MGIKCPKSFIRVMEIMIGEIELPKVVRQPLHSVGIVIWSIETKDPAFKIKLTVKSNINAPRQKPRLLTCDILRQYKYESIKGFEFNKWEDRLKEAHAIVHY